jgi:hypothetical protein
VTNSDARPESDDAVARRTVFKWFGGCQQRAQFANANLEQSQRVHRVAEIEVFGRIIATGSSITKP